MNRKFIINLFLAGCWFPMSLLPARTAVDRDNVQPSVRDLDMDRVFNVLRSETARNILSILYENPAVASEIASQLDTSTQNVGHHLGNLLEADLVTVADTWYSAKGREMKVYAPTNEPLVLVIGSDESEDVCRRALAMITGKEDR